MRAGLFNRSPARSRTLAASSLPTNRSPRRRRAGSGNEGAGVEQPIYGLARGDHCADEDGQHDGVSRPAFRAIGPEHERDSERDRGSVSPPLWIKSARSATDRTARTRPPARRRWRRARRDYRTARTPSCGPECDRAVNLAVGVTVGMVTMAAGVLPRPDWQAGVPVRPVMVMLV